MLFLRFRGDIRVDYNKRGAKREKLEKLCVWGEILVEWLQKEETIRKKSPSQGTKD